MKTYRHQEFFKIFDFSKQIIEFDLRKDKRSCRKMQSMASTYGEWS